MTSQKRRPKVTLTADGRLMTAAEFFALKDKRV